MSTIDWGTVSTSMLTSGGLLFVAYKLWFQRRLEDHKRKLENNSKLFEIEKYGIEKGSAVTLKIQYFKRAFRSHLSRHQGDALHSVVLIEYNIRSMHHDEKSANGACSSPD